MRERVLTEIMFSIPTSGSRLANWRTLFLAYISYIREASVESATSWNYFMIFSIAILLITFGQPTLLISQLCASSRDIEGDGILVKRKVGQVYEI
jgi:hypothetical protein